MRTFFTLFISLFLFSTSSFAQILVNTDWANEIGLPQPDIAWSASIANGPSGGPITVGNTMTASQGTNILITVHNRGGSLLWEQQWNGAASGDDYGTCVAFSDSLIVLAGATYNAVQDAMDYVVLGYNAINGTLLWTRIYNGTGNGQDVPAAIALDAAAGYVFVTGGSMGNSTLWDYATLCLDADDGIILWQQRYDYAGKYDAAVRIAVGTGRVTITGASGDAFNDWDFCTISYNKTSGAVISTKRIENASWYFDQPTDMVQDTLGNVFICGKTTNINGDEDIKVLKMNMSLILLWERTIDIEGEDDSATAIEIDDDGNTYLTGYYTTDVNTKGFVAYKLNSSGTAVWSKKFAAPWGGDFVGTDVSRRGNDYIYTGYLQGESGTTDMLVYLLDQHGNQKLFTTFNYETNHEHGLAVQFSEDNSFTVYGTTTSPLGSKRYLSVRYDYKLRDMEPVVIDSLPAYHSSEMIARFRTNVLNYDFIDNKDLRFAKLEDVVSPTAQAMIDSVLETRTKHWTVTKIFPYLTSANQTMLNAHGIEVQLPQFYTWLTLSIPKEETIEEVIPILDELGDVFVDVSFNECIVPFSAPNDVSYDSLQKSLHLVGTNFIYPPHIDIEQAWNYSVGSRANIDGGTNTTVGVFDTGVNENHEDLNILGGYDFYYNSGNSTALNPENDQTHNSHGTAMAGIIAAKRNNDEMGVAGIAGGDWENFKRGVNIINYKILNDGGGIPDEPDVYYTHMNTVFTAMVAASSIGSHPTVDIYNCSWGVNEPADMPGLPVQYSCWDECAILLTTLARQGSVLVAGSGNTGAIDVPKFPASTRPPGQSGDIEFTGSPDEFVICVGGSGADGLGNLFTDKGYFVDVVAPSAPDLIYTTINGDSLYGHIGATSPAAAHVSGVCALIHDYLTYSDEAANAVSVPVAEDYEKIITNSAFDIIEHPLFPIDTESYSEGWDELSANGLLNARAALEYVDLNYNKIWHFNSINADFDIDYSGPMNLNFTQEYNTVAGMDGLPSGQYDCDVYQVNAHTEHTLFGETMVDYWPLHSQSNTYHLVQEGDPFTRIMQFPQTQMISCDETGAYLRGYTFFVKNPVGNPGQVINQWYPIDTLNAYMAYSVYSTISTSINTPKSKADWGFSLYPNPAANQLFLKLPEVLGSSLDISIHDISGKLVQQERNTIEKAGNKIKIMDISALASGIYLCSIKSENKISTLKFIKQ